MKIENLVFGVILLKHFYFDYLLFQSVYDCLLSNKISKDKC